jgi:hypothetical protein
MQLDVSVATLPRILRYLADVIDALCLWSHRTSCSASTQKLRDEIHSCEQRIMDMPELATLPDLSESKENYNSASTMSVEVATEIFRIGVLVYIARICEAQFGEKRDDIKLLLDKAFALVRWMPTCDRLLPIFVIGCEARTDEHRMAVLDLVRRTEKNTHVRSLCCFRRGLDSVWIQDDLHADQDVTLDYLNKLSVIISSSPTLPTFV